MTQNKPPAKNNVPVEQQIGDAVRKGLDHDIDQAYSDLFEKNKQNNQLPQELFVNIFLPYFAGKVKDDVHLNLTTKWVAVAGSTMNPVDVIDNDGNKLFTVPPLMSSDFLREQDNLRGKSFNDIFNNAQNQAARLPTLGGRIIAAEGSAKINSMGVAPENSQVEQWNAIFDRYGIDHPKTESGKPINTQKSNGSDELDFD